MYGDYGKVVLVVITLCAVSHTFEIKPRIHKGYKSERHQFPYHALLEIYNNQTKQLLACGASLISDQWLITAAHCLTSADQLAVHVGALSIYDVFEESETFAITRDNMHIYSKAFQMLHWNDIGLIKLPRPVKLSKYVKPVQLPTKCETNQNIEVVVAGIGAESDNNLSCTSSLRFTYLNTTSWLRCQIEYPFLFLRKSVICASGSEKQSVCHGDSGGGIFVIIDKKPKR